MCVVEEELMMLGVGEATRRVFDGAWTVTCDGTVWCCVCVTVLVSVAISMAVSVRIIGGGGSGRACEEKVCQQAVPRQ